VSSWGHSLGRASSGQKESGLDFLYSELLLISKPSRRGGLGAGGRFGRSRFPRFLCLLLGTVNKLRLGGVSRRQRQSGRLKGGLEDAKGGANGVFWADQLEMAIVAVPLNPKNRTEGLTLPARGCPRPLGVCANPPGIACQGFPLRLLVSTKRDWSPARVRCEASRPSEVEDLGQSVTVPG
jgi:hypothetical protein